MKAHATGVESGAALRDAAVLCDRGASAADVCSSALRSSSLSVLEPSKLPSLVQAGARGSYMSQVAVVRCREAGRWFLDGEPVITVTLGVFWLWAEVPPCAACLEAAASAAGDV